MSKLHVYGPDEKVRAAPFNEVELDLSAWWEGIEAEDEDEGVKP